MFHMHKRTGLSCRGTHNFSHFPLLQGRSQDAIHSGKLCNHHCFSQPSICVSDLDLHLEEHSYFLLCMPSTPLPSHLFYVLKRHLLSPFYFNQKVTGTWHSGKDTTVDALTLECLALSPSSTSDSSFLAHTT